MENDQYTTPFGGRLNHPDDLAKHAKTKTYKDNLLDKDSPVVYTTLYLDGKPFLDKSTFSVDITQKTNHHDTFTITVPDDAIDDFHGLVMEKSKHLLGGVLTINFHRYGDIRQTFVGIIAGITNPKKNGYGKLMIQGYAPTILLENGKQSRSFENKTLEQIIQEVSKEYPKDLVRFNTEQQNTKTALPYTVQYQESDYQFLQRLAARNGEYFYYDGQVIIFGNKAGKTLELEDGKDLFSAELQVGIAPQHFRYSAYDTEAGRDLFQESTSVQIQNKINPYQAVAVIASKKIYPQKAQNHFNAAGLGRMSSTELSEAVRKEKEVREHLVRVKGESWDPQVKIGDFARLLDINSRPMETYRVMEIRHYHDGNKYENTFIGIPDIWVPPYQDNTALPKIEEQPARVVDNNDPLGMGRVKVQFPWQVAKGEKTPWVRMIQPHSGAGKGFHFIPEIGEEVMVGFEGGNAEKPFLLGTHYNGSETSSYHTAGNDKKAIHTRSGTKIILNDAEGSVFIEDPSGNTYLMDGKGNIKVKAPNNISFDAGKNMYLNVGENLFTQVGINKTDFVGMNYARTVGMNYTSTITGDSTTSIKGKGVTMAEKEMKIEAKETNIAGYDKLFVHSNKNAVFNSKGTVDIKGEDGTSSTNVADSMQKEIPHSTTQAIVHFVAKDWKGEFGLCWLRGGNKEISDSEDYKKLVGKYYQFEDSLLTPLEQGQKSESDYKKDLEKRDKKFKEILEKYYKNEEKSRFPDINTASSYTRFYITNDNAWFKRRQRVKEVRDANNNTKQVYEPEVVETIVNFKNDPQYKDGNSYADLQEEYAAFHYSKFKKRKKDGKEDVKEEIFTYYQPFLALFPKTENYGVSEAVFTLDITFLEAGNKPDYLIFKVDNKILDMKHPNIGIDQLKIEKPKGGEKVKITCKSSTGFTDNKVIQVYAVKIQPDQTEIETLAGCITMVAPVVKTMNLVTIKVKTKEEKGSYGMPADGWLDFYKNILGQALIKVNIIEKRVKDDIRIDISDTPGFKNTFKVDSDGNIGKRDSFASTMYQKFKDNYPEYAEGYFKLYFVDVECKEKGDDADLQGYSNYDDNWGVMFSKHDKGTIAHESLHALGLPHSYFYRNSGRCRSYVFKALETHNIMDYSNWGADLDGNARTPKERYYIMHWQWSIIRGSDVFSIIPKTN